VSALNAIPHIEAGTLRLLAISAPKRMTGTLGTVPTWQESGYRGVIGSWRGLIGPKGLTPAQVTFWDNVAQRTLKDPQFRKFAEGIPYEITYIGPGGVSKWLAEENEELRKVLTSIGFAK
jgi:putative tricarboxylic transport membrane protein